MSAPTAKPSTAHLSFALSEPGDAGMCFHPGDDTTSHLSFASSEPGDAGMCFRPYDLGTDLHLTLNGIDEKHLALLACR